MIYKYNGLWVAGPLYFVVTALWAFLLGLWDLAGGVKVIYLPAVLAGLGCWLIGGIALW